MKLPDLDRARSEEFVTQKEFLTRYNQGLPTAFPRASAALLNTFKASYPGQFKPEGAWSLDLHRKKFMDWLPAYLKSLEP